MRHFYDTSDYYDRELEKFSDLDSPFQRYRISKILRLHTPKATDRVLDLGCGWGTFCFALAPLCREVVGIDYSSKAVELCREFQKRHEGSNVTFRCASIEDTGELSSSFDAVLCADLVEHLYPELFEALVREAYRVLERGGKLVIWTPHRGHLLEILKAHNLLLKQDPSHVDFKSMARIVSTLQAHRFVIEKAYYDESHLPGFRHLERVLGGFFPLFRRRIAVLAEKQS